MTKPLPRHPMDAVLNQHQVGHGRKSPELQFETQQLRTLLGALKLNVGKTLGRLADEYGPNPGFAQFSLLYPSFPVLFGTTAMHRLHLDKRAFLPAWFNKFDALPVFEPFYVFRDALTHAAGRAAGLIFPRKGVRGGLVLHDAVGTLPFTGTAAFVYEGGTPDYPDLLYVRPFLRLVEAIVDRGHGWRPEEV